MEYVVDLICVHILTHQNILNPCDKCVDSLHDRRVYLTDLNKNKIPNIES